MDKDVSKKTILVLVVFTLVISVFSLFTVVTTLDSNSKTNYVPTPTSVSNVQSGQVKLGVNEVLEPDMKSGQIILNIV